MWIDDGCYAVTVQAPWHCPQHASWYHREHVSAALCPSPRLSCTLKWMKMIPGIWKLIRRCEHVVPVYCSLGYVLFASLTLWGFFWSIDLMWCHYNSNYNYVVIKVSLWSRNAAQELGVPWARLVIVKLVTAFSQVYQISLVDQVPRGLGVILMT